MANLQQLEVLVFYAADVSLLRDPAKVEIQRQSHGRTFASQATEKQRPQGSREIVF